MKITYFTAYDYIIQTAPEKHTYSTPFTVARYTDDSGNHRYIVPVSRVYNGEDGYSLLEYTKKDFFKSFSLKQV